MPHATRVSQTQTHQAHAEEGPEGASCMNETRLNYFFAAPPRGSFRTAPEDVEGIEAGRAACIGSMKTTRRRDVHRHGWPPSPRSKPCIHRMPIRRAGNSKTSGRLLKKDAGRLWRPASCKAATRRLSGLRSRPVRRRRRHRAVRPVRRDRWREPGRSSRRRRHLR